MKFSLPSLSLVLFLSGCTEPRLIGQNNKEQAKKLDGIVLPDSMLESDYKFMRIHNVPSEAVLPIDGERLKYIVNGFERGDLDKSWLGRFTSKPWEYAIKTAENDVDFNEERTNIIEKIYSKLSNREHAYRTNNNYSEYLSQIYKINSKHMLILLKKYIEFFDNQNKWENFEKWFLQGRYSDEEGALVINSQEGYSAIDFNTEWQERFFAPRFGHGRRNEWGVPYIVSYTGIIGVIHSHLKKINEGIESIAGPSGSLEPTGDNPDNDTSTLVYHNRYNPCLMFAVITYIDENRRNADVFFRDIKNANGLPVNSLDIIVIDVGVYEKGKPIIKSE